MLTKTVPREAGPRKQVPACCFVALNTVELVLVMQDAHLNIYLRRATLVWQGREENLRSREALASSVASLQECMS